MNFREFYLLNENRFYFAYLDNHGEYTVNPHFFPTAYERDAVANITSQEHKPRKLWYFTVKPGDHKINIPGATPEEQEQIGVAYYKRMGLHKPFVGYTPEEDVEGNIIEPKYFDPNYWNKVAAKQNALRTPFRVPDQGKTLGYPPPSQSS
jgi:hypothetical protein